MNNTTTTTTKKHNMNTTTQAKYLITDKKHPAITRNREPVQTSQEVYFTENTTAAVDTLFNPHMGRTASGTFRKLSGGILFRDLKGEKRAFLVMNKQGEKFFVSCFQDEKGKTFFMNALSSNDERFLGIHGLSFSEKSILAHNIASSF
jgi:hypothetical protein